MLETGARRRPDVDSNVPAGGPSVIRELGKDNLARSRGDGDSLDDAGITQALADGVTSSSGEIQSLISRDGGGQRAYRDIC